MARKRKVTELNVANGKAWNGAKSIDELLGIYENPYSVGSIEAYETQIRAMNEYDLHSHAASMFVIPRDNREFLITQLLREYKTKSIQYKNSPTVTSAIPNPSKIILDIMSEGK